MNRATRRKNYSGLMLLCTLASAAVGFASPATVSPARADAAPTGRLFAAAEPVPQTIGLSGATPNFDLVTVQSPHVYDYTFASAPTDWRVQSGVWGMMNRWACSPGWNWFGGESDEVAAIWNKRRFSGDLSVQYYFGFKMGVVGTGVGAAEAGWWNKTRVWEYLSDAALSFDGDGTNLSSGYTLIIGADDNHHTILKRRDKIVCETTDPAALFPTFTDGGPDDHGGKGPGQFEVVHRRWWYVRMDKIGPQISCYLDNKLLFSYTDPKPLDVGQVALWTYRNGIMLSRVQIYYDRQLLSSRSGPVAAAPKAAAPVKVAKHPAATLKRTRWAAGDMQHS